MRFATWPALKTAFVIFTVTLPSLILADNPITSPAQAQGVDILFINPTGVTGENKYYPGENDVITWYVSKKGDSKLSRNP
jgi:hypothetical protein